jgi:hypothetical protein
MKAMANKNQFTALRCERSKDKENLDKMVTKYEPAL